jgi:hypothetical protein
MRRTHVSQRLAILLTVAMIFKGWGRDQRARFMAVVVSAAPTAWRSSTPCGGLSSLVSSFAAR